MIVFQRRIANVLAGWIALVLAISILAAIDLRHGGRLYGRLALVPDRVWRGELWRLATWIFVELGPAALIFGCVAIYWFGGELLAAWGNARFVRVLALGALVTGLATTLAAPGLGTDHGGYFGAAAMGDGLLIAWGRTFPTRRIRVLRVLEMDGQTFALWTAGFTVLAILYWGLGPVLPEAIAATLAFAYTGRRWPRLRVERGGRPPEPPHGPYDSN